VERLKLKVGRQGAGDPEIPMNVEREFVFGGRGQSRDIEHKTWRGQEVVNWLKVGTKVSVHSLCVRTFTQIFRG